MLPTTVSSLLILGTDAVLAGAPATPVQLAHACLRAGYRMVVPSSWGDELIAARALERIAQSSTPLVQVSCPHVSRRIASNADALAPMLMCLVPPPVAAAEYLRALYAPARAHITFAGHCPSGSHASIDSWLSPDELFASLVERGIVLTQQPTEFDSVLPPDRRRFYSEPGGSPSAQTAQALDVPVQLVEAGGDDFAVEVAQQLLSEMRILVTPAARLGCSCSGVGTGISAHAARARLAELEPPRAASPVVDHDIRLVLDDGPPMAPGIEEAPYPAASEPLPPAPRPRRSPQSIQPVAEVGAIAVEAQARRRSPTSTPRPVLGALPMARKGGETGRQLPRAYVARRRSSPSGVRKLTSADRPRLGVRPAWPWIALAGVGAGLALAWLLGLAG